MRVALALGSGGARGYAHIGAIRELEARGHEVVGVSGASMGAVVGSLFAAGKLDDFEEWVRGLAQRDVLRLLDVSFAGGGAIRATKIMAVIGAMLDDVRIEDLPVPFTAVATDLRARREVWFNRGPADVAVRASFAIPSVITPALVGGRLIIDGGVTNPVPLEPLAPVESDLLLAVSLTGRRSGLRGSTYSESSDPDETSADAEPRLQRRGDAAAPRSPGRLTGRIRTAAADVRDADLVRLIAARFGLESAEDTDATQDTDATDDPSTAAPSAHGDPGGDRSPAERVEEAVDEGETEVAESGAGVDGEVEHSRPVDGHDPADALPGSLRIFDVVTHSIEVMQHIVTAYRMAGNRPDVLVEVPSDACSTFDFHRAAELIELGRRLTADALDRAGV